VYNFSHKHEWVVLHFGHTTMAKLLVPYFYQSIRLQQFKKMSVTWHWCNNTLSTFDHNTVVLLQTSSLGNPFIEVNVHLVLIIMKGISVLLVVSPFLSLFICTDAINLNNNCCSSIFSLGSFFFWTSTEKYN